MLVVTRHALGSLTIPVVSLKDPRTGRDDRFCFQWHLETALYGGATGGLYRLLARASLGSCTLSLSKAAVLAGTVSAAHFKELVDLLSESLPFESQVPTCTPLLPPHCFAPLFPRATSLPACQGRVRNVALLAVNHVPALCNHFGRCDKTVALMRALSQPIPRLWEALAEQERDRADGVLDLVLEDGRRTPRSLSPPLALPTLSRRFQPPPLQRSRRLTRSRRTLRRSSCSSCHLLVTWRTTRRRKAGRCRRCRLRCARSLTRIHCTGRSRSTAYATEAASWTSPSAATRRQPFAS